MPDSVEQLIYAEAQRGLALQVVLLNELRSRTGIMLAVITAASAFLGPAAINQGGLHAWGVLAIAAFAIAIGCCLTALWPHREWTFYESARKLVRTYCDLEHPDGSGPWVTNQVQRDLALHMEQHTEQARDTMKGIQQWFMGAGISLVVEVACWLIEYGT